ncbi:MAG: hypothetical protein QG596_663 [Actinomycetota bacterium]|nr:hypothetical protein [Actinomycetota bacterium]
MDVYDYEVLGDDLDMIMSSATGSDVVLGGHSMGSHTVARRAILEPQGVKALVLIGPVFTGEVDDDERWDRRADALENGGPEAFAEVVAENSPNEEIRERTFRLARDRARLHKFPQAVAQALRQIPRSRPFDHLDQLRDLRMPVLVVASHDDFDPGHPHETAVRWAQLIPGAELVSEEPGDPPLAWQGGKLSREIDAFLAKHNLNPDR